MEKFLEEIKKTYNIDNLRITEAVYNKSSETCTVSFLTDENISEETKKEITSYCCKNIIEKIVVKFKKNVIDEFVIAHHIKEFLSSKFKTIYDLIDLDKIEINLKETPIITFSLTQELYDLFIQSAKKQIQNFLIENFFSNFIISEKIIESKFDDSILVKREKMLVNQPINLKDQIFFNDVCDLVGVNAAKFATAIKDITSEVKDVNLCGKIQFLKKRNFMREKKGINVEKSFFTFMLNDTTGKISVTAFANKASLTKYEKLADDTNILAFGDVELFRERLSFKIKTLALIGDFKYKKSETRYRDIPKAYTLIKPEKIDNYFQINLLEKRKEPCKFLQENTIVVFDLETTGLDARIEKIIEIGAVKIVNGDIVESFSTFINPRQKLVPKIIELTGIVDSDLENAPHINEVIGDFLNFCKDSVMMAYNSNFDMSFINIAAKENNYFVDNKVIDAMSLVYKAGLGLQNYKLKTALAALGLENKNAHRAIHDAEATAELVIKLSEFFD